MTGGVHHVFLTVNDLARSRAFYAALMPRLGYPAMNDFGSVLGWSSAGGSFWLKQADAQYAGATFSKDRVGLAAVFFFTGGIGQICAYFHGWSTAREWNNRRLMVAWTVILVVFILFILMFLGTILAFLSHRFPHS